MQFYISWKQAQQLAYEEMKHNEKIKRTKQLHMVLGSRIIRHEII